MNWHDLLCCCIPIKPLSNLWVQSDQTTSSFHRFPLQPHRSPLNFQHQTVQPLAWWPTLQRSLGRKESIFDQVGIVICLFLKGFTLSRYDIWGVSSTNCQTDRMWNMWYMKCCNIEHSVRWTYSPRTAISIIQGNVITNLSIQCSAVLPQAKIIQGLFLLIFSFCLSQGIQQFYTTDLPNTIRAVPPRRSRPHRGAG